jgi:hypothetical protein
MKKPFLILVICSSLFVSCANGFLRGGDPGSIQAGSIIGGAIGGIVGNHMDHWNGYAIGSMMGSITGAVVANEATRPKYDDSYSDQSNDNGSYSKPIRKTEQSSFDSDYRDTISETDLEVRNIRFIDQNRNRTIDRDEVCHLIFDIYNAGSITAYNAKPVITIVDGERQLLLSIPEPLQMLMPGEVAMYDISIQASKHLRKTYSTFRIEVSDRDGYSKNYRQFTINIQNGNQ